MNIKENRRILVTEKDWWTGEVLDGRSDLFPSSYMKLL